LLVSLGVSVVTEGMTARSTCQTTEGFHHQIDNIFTCHVVLSQDRVIVEENVEVSDEV
jgi:hypothetical protein